MIARTVDIAGLRLRFRGDAAAIQVVDRRYRAFAVEPDRDAATFDVALDLHALNAAGPPVDEPFGAYARGDLVLLSGAGVNAVVDGNRRFASIRGPRTERPVDAVMRYLVATDLLSRGGVLAHASAVVVGGRAWVFAGPSGAGKTTIATMLEGELLCDEAVALLPRGDGIAAHATPYWTARPGCAPVAGILFPVRGATPSWRPLSPAMAVARLLPEVGPMLAGEMPRALRAACGLIDSTHCATITLPTIDHIRAWLQPRLDAHPPPYGREHGVAIL